MNKQLLKDKLFANKIVKILNDNQEATQKKGDDEDDTREAAI
jgi:hypothetical protein